MFRLIKICAVLLSLSACAQLDDARSDLRDFAIADAEAAKALAIASGDIVGANCWDQIAADIRARQAVPSPETNGVMVRWQRARNLRRGLSGLSEAFNTACAPVVLDAGRTAFRLRRLGGVP